MTFKSIAIVAVLIVAFLVPVDRYQQVSHKWSSDEIASYRQSVTIIDAIFRDGSVAESAGVVIGKDGTTLTVAHLFRHGEIDTIIMTVPNGNVYELDILTINSRIDLALVRPKAAAPYFKYLPIYRSAIVDPNEDLLVIGHPMWLYNHVEFGVMLGTYFDIFYGGCISCISALVRPGNSGGPVINTHGEVIGIVSASAHDPVTWQFKYGMAVAISEIHIFLRLAESMKPYWPRQIRRYRLDEVKK